MEEPEIALPPHTQRRIANYLLTQTTQCFVTSHSPYVIEHFGPEGILRLTRDLNGILNGTRVVLPDSMKAKTYRSQLRRALAEAMLGNGAIVGEGMTEQYALGAVARKLEDASADLFPLDLAGLSIINTEGDGNLEAMGNFFRGLGIPGFAFFDKKNRKPEEMSKIQAAFMIAKEIGYRGVEAMLAAEIPIDRQWQFLMSIRAQDSENHFGIPATRPTVEEITKLTTSTLKGLKGEGGAARLIEICLVTELPTTIVQFLTDIYALFPRPKRNAEASTPEKVSAATATEGKRA
jgi:putative ATP-dependent endonuclease of OLD family